MTRLTRQCISDLWARTTVLLAAILTVVALAPPAMAWAQEARGTITGTIRDSSGSVIPGATVTISNKEMGTTVTVVTNEVGFYQIPYAAGNLSGQCGAPAASSSGYWYRPTAPLT